MKLFDGLQSKLRGDEPKDVADEADDGERRLNNRRPIDAPVIVKVGSAQHDCRLTDIGPAGAFLTPAFVAALGSDVEVSITNTRISAAARVTRIAPDGVGIRFNKEAAGAIMAAWSRGLFK